MPDRPRRASRLPQVLLAAGTGLVIAWTVNQSFVNHAGWVLPGWALPVLVAGCVLVPIPLSLTDLPARLARPNVDFWGGGPLTAIAIAASLYGLLAMVWGIVFVQIVGTPPP